MERIIVPLAIAAVVVMLLLGINAGLIYVLVGILMAPMGIIGFIDDSNITVRDSDFSTFIRSLGAVMGGQGMTAVYALATIDKKSLVALEPLVNSVYSKMNLGLDDKQVWDKFIGESGSNLIYKYLNIYLDTMTLGGPPDAIGTVVGSSMLEQTLLREKKDMHARSFIILLVPMHIAMAGIFVVLYRIMVVLTGSVATMMDKFQTNVRCCRRREGSRLGVSLPTVHSAACPFSPTSLRRRWEFMWSSSLTIITDIQYLCSTDSGRWRQVYVLFLCSNILFTDRSCAPRRTHSSGNILQP